jgi:NADH-quinone oxidoreductase subunit F
MVSIHTAQELDTWRESLGSEKVWTAFQDELTNQKAKAKLNYDVKVTGCHGFCEKGPLVVIHPQGIMYTNVKVSDVAEIVGETIVNNTVIERLLYVDPQTNEEIECEQDVPFYKHQHRLILGLNGLLDPTRIEEYISQGGFDSLKKVLVSLSPEDVIEEMKKSGLRGRGGAGFPTGFKWELCRQQPGDVKYVICNADEGDPGAYMDRSIMEGNPHLVLEGMIIGAYAMGANQGYVYIRNEYPLAVKHLRQAISQAEEVGLLGENILDSGFDFTVKIKLGSGAFVCGEETALIASIEGQIGEPRPRPPYPAEFGLWGKPTNINNVKSWASVPIIIDKGSDWYASIGTETSKGTVIFSVVGNINNTGLVEVPIGISLRELIFDIGGGIPDGKSFKAAQIGGPSGGCIPAEHLDIPIDYESLQSRWSSPMKIPAWLISPPTSCASPRKNPAGNVCPAAWERRPCSKRSNASVPVTASLGTWITSSSWVKKSNGPPSAAWVKRRQTRCFPPSATSAMNMKPTLSIKPVRPAYARA